MCRGTGKARIFYRQRSIVINKPIHNSLRTNRARSLATFRNSSRSREQYPHRKPENQPKRREVAEQQLTNVFGFRKRCFSTTHQRGHSGEAESRESHEASQVKVDQARRRYGERVPKGALTEHDMELYERYYGTSSFTGEGADSEDHPDVVLEASHEGEYQQIFTDSDNPPHRTAEERPDQEILDAIEEHVDIPDVETVHLRQKDHEEGFDEHTAEGEELRAHPYTLATRSGTNPSTIHIPWAKMVQPVEAMLATSNNKHLREAAEKAFGGPGLPYSANTTLVARKMTQKPISLTSYQSSMSPMDATVFYAALSPALYASSLHVLLEVRRRLGISWLKHLRTEKSNGNILDAGTGGAGVIAWRELLKAELWTEEQSAVDAMNVTSLGRATVLTGSEMLQKRASSLLENTTFIPRLPDYVHVQTASIPARKQFDVILASHGLWSLSEEWMRKQHIHNLWKMLNPDGGVLILLEKGVPRGFEVIAQARDYLLKDFLHPSTGFDSGSGGENTGSGSHAANKKSSVGAIIAPCTTHAKCPLYRLLTVSPRRKDHCHFYQRYLRPSYLQQLLGAKSRNYDDVEFSYIAVQRGVSKESLRLDIPMQYQNDQSRILIGKEATDRAFEGYGVNEFESIEFDYTERTAVADHSDQMSSSLAQTTAKDNETVERTPEGYTSAPNPFTLPRILSTPLKRHGHVLMDVCTPGGEFERWTVTKSYNKQAYRDARKAAWGDLWPLGAKSRVIKDVRLGSAIPAKSTPRSTVHKTKSTGKGTTYKVAATTRPSKRQKLKEKRRWRAQTA